MSALGTLRLVNAIGMTLNINVADVEDAYSTMRRYGALGWTSGDIPAGGMLLPYAMADSFDWALIGAHEWTSPEAERGVFHRGQFYKRREYEAKTTGKKMPAAIKYSRGAKPTDPPHLKEGDDDGVQYVTLAVFKGAGQVERVLTKPAQRERPAVAAPPGDVLDRDLGHHGHRAVAEGPLGLITDGQRNAVLNKLQAHGIDVTTPEGTVLLREMVHSVMGGAEHVDAAHLPALMAKIASRAA